MRSERSQDWPNLVRASIDADRIPGFFSDIYFTNANSLSLPGMPQASAYGRACRTTRRRCIHAPYFSSSRAGAGASSACPCRSRPWFHQGRPLDCHRWNSNGANSRGNPAQIAALSTNQAPTAIIGCLHMTLPFRTHPVFTIIITFLAPAFERPLLLCLES